MILSFDTFCDEIHHRASRPLATSRLMTIVGHANLKISFKFFVVYWSIFGDSRQCLRSSVNNPKAISTTAVVFIFPSSRCNSKLSTKLSLLFFFSPSFRLWRVGHLSLLSIQGPKLIMIFRDYHRQERECKLIFKTFIIST